MFEGVGSRSHESRQTYRRLECLDLAPLELKREMRLCVPEQTWSQKAEVEPDPENNYIRGKPCLGYSTLCLGELKGLVRQDIISRSLLQNNLQTEMRICNVNREKEGASAHPGVQRPGDEEGRETIEDCDKNIVYLDSYTENVDVVAILNTHLLNSPEYFIPSKQQGLSENPTFSPSIKPSDIDKETVEPYSGCTVHTEREIETKNRVDSLPRFMTFQTFKGSEKNKRLPDILQPYYMQKC